jgi:hypothetical protein
MATTGTCFVPEVLTFFLGFLTTNTYKGVTSVVVDLAEGGRSTGEEPKSGI